MNGKIFSNVKILAIIAIAVIFFSASALMLQDNTQAEIIEYDGVQRAVIIDQLYKQIPNELFHEQASQLLEDAGYQVDIFTTEDITVDFYKELPSMNYQYIVIRTHSADDKTNSSVALFTGEEYTEDNYISEQLSGHVAKGTPLQLTVFRTGGESSDWNVFNFSHRELISSFVRETQNREEFFLITPKLVSELMVGKFPGSTILIGGCDSLSNTSLAESLIGRGASTIIGWDDTIDNFRNDADMLVFLEANLKNDMEIPEAVDFTTNNREWGNDVVYNAKLAYYSE